MAEFIETLMERPLSHRVGGWVLSLLVVSFVYWQYFYKARAEELTELSTTVENLETQISHERRLARDLPRIRALVKELDVKLKKAMAQLPDKREIPQLLASISDLATDAGLEVSLFKPKADNYKDFYVEVPVAVSVEGTFHQVATFFDEVAHLDRIVNISGITLKEPKVSDEVVTLQADYLATTFRFLDDEERKIRQSKSKGRKRRK